MLATVHWRAAGIWDEFQLKGLDPIYPLLMILGAFVSDFEKSDFETKILYIIEKAEN